jgi:hypothetical protein
MTNIQAHAGLDLPAPGPGLLPSLAGNWWLLLRGIAANAPTS